jgi:hypothetical protein
MSFVRFEAFARSAADQENTATMVANDVKAKALAMKEKC